MKSDRNYDRSLAAVDQGQSAQKSEGEWRVLIASEQLSHERAEAAEARLQALQQRVQVLEQKWRSSASRIGALQADVLFDCADELATLTQPGAASPEVKS